MHIIICFSGISLPINGELTIGNSSSDRQSLPQSSNSFVSQILGAATISVALLLMALE